MRFATWARPKDALKYKGISYYTDKEKVIQDFRENPYNQKYWTIFSVDNTYPKALIIVVNKKL